MTDVASHFTAIPRDLPKYSRRSPQHPSPHRRWGHLMSVILVGGLIGSCGAGEDGAGLTRGGPGRRAEATTQQPVTVDVAIVQNRRSDDETQYTGTTQPARWCRPSRAWMVRC
ncbi:MAG: hypothetical protein HC795_01765 [Coleofasciculaceae cyanobacterium RL_1_1]|nr:hypothetical protein [Coleofasciculaceae cyanobacterium RL_1_1]